MNTRVWIGVFIILLSVEVFYSCITQTKLREAELRVEHAEEVSAQLSNDQVRQSWEKVEDAALTLMEAEQDKRREALLKFRHELQRLKSRIGYKQLGGMSKKEDLQP